jgi:hypothetical protein
MKASKFLFPIKRMDIENIGKKIKTSCHYSIENV